MFDHLVLKQPNLISVNVFSLHDPHDILIENKSLQLTDYFDCMEAARYIGTTEIESLDKLESMKFEIKLSREFQYYLKIQLIVVNASKIVHYQQRSDLVFRQLQTKKTWLRRTIDVINGSALINSILSRKDKLSNAAGQSIHCLAKMIRSFLDDETANDPFTTFQATLKAELESLLAKCAALKAKKSQELCLYCGDKIAVDKLTCKDNHEVSRCAITQLQNTFIANNICSECERCVTSLEILKEVTGKDEQLCPYCDRLIIFE